jgi:hypothetical protein
MTPPPKLASPTQAKPAEDDDEEDDYMTMVFTDGGSISDRLGESSLQRRQRLQRQGEIRGRTKSKAELAAEAEATRERALATSLLADPQVAQKSKGFAIMAKMGFAGGALGKQSADGSSKTEPIRISIKEDRGGIGMESEKKRKFREAAEAAEGQAKKAKADEGEYRDRVRRERETTRLEKQVQAAQRIAEKMNDEKDMTPEHVPGDKTTSRIASRPLKSINVLWRGPVRAREEAERDRRMRYDLEQSLSRLPTYEDDDEDLDDKKALGKAKIVYATADDLDEEDPELDEYNALEPGEKLRRLVLHLRQKHHYCFWCKFTYPDQTMEGCPGLTEEDHD